MEQEHEIDPNKLIWLQHPPAIILSNSTCSTYICLVINSRHTPQQLVFWAAPFWFVIKKLPAEQIRNISHRKTRTENHDTKNLAV
jgi:hypothetical protein